VSKIFDSTNKKILFLISHPSDEIIFFWSLLQEMNIEKTILMVSTDIYNNDFKYDKLTPLKEICNETNTNLITLNYDNFFYSLEMYPKKNYQQLHYFIRKQLKDIDYDYLFTHNPYGEYNHPDNILLFNASLLYSKTEIIYTDIIYDNIKNKINNIYYKDSNKLGEYYLDENMYYNFKNKYLNNRSWNYDFDIFKKCNLYIL